MLCNRVDRDECWSCDYGVDYTKYISVDTRVLLWALGHMPRG